MVNVCVPDCEFEESNTNEVMNNYRDHEWLVTDFEGNFDLDSFIELFEVFKDVTGYDCYDASERKMIIDKIASFIMDYKLTENNK